MHYDHAIAFVVSTIMTLLHVDFEMHTTHQFVLATFHVARFAIVSLTIAATINSTTAI
jgi:hypothetical protein